ncbi:MAG: class I SAM-dependent methyltransferase [Candidatus Altiarchaeota archaeon]|nr:class I SAM-dependent methyltransferase [Candidatus Altiarchaeota archaeon]
MDDYTEDYFKSHSNYKLSGGYESLRKDVIFRVRLVIKKFFKNLDRNAKVLCIGTAYGYDVEAFLQEGFKDVYGMDISKHAIKEAKKTYKNKAKFFVDDAEKPKVKEKFDLIYAFDVVEHIPNPLKALTN